MFVVASDAELEVVAADIKRGLADGSYDITHGWLVEVVAFHTCGTDNHGYYGMHEPSCGSIPIMQLVVIERPND